MCASKSVSSFHELPQVQTKPKNQKSILVEHYLGTDGAYNRDLGFDAVWKQQTSRMHEILLSRLPEILPYVR